MAKNLREEFKTKIMKDLMNTLSYKNQLEVPMLKKIVVNMGMGEAMSDSKYLDGGLNDMKAITGQKPLLQEQRNLLPHIKSEKVDRLDVLLL